MAPRVLQTMSDSRKRAQSVDAIAAACEPPTARELTSGLPISREQTLSILEHLLVLPHPIVVDSEIRVNSIQALIWKHSRDATKDLTNTLSVLHTCIALHQEATPIFYGLNTFEIDNVDEIAAFAHRISKTARNSIRHILLRPAVIRHIESSHIPARQQEAQRLRDALALYPNLREISFDPILGLALQEKLVQGIASLARLPSLQAFSIREVDVRKLSPFWQELRRKRNLHILARLRSELELVERERKEARWQMDDLTAAEQTPLPPTESPEEI